MADGRDEVPGYGPRRTYLWWELFRCFQVALDPRKLLVAAAGILLMSFGWYVLSAIFYSDKTPQLSDPAYNESALAKELEGQNLDAAAIRRVADTRFQRDLAQWRALDELAGPSGRLSTLPWAEYRGHNPYELLTKIFSGSARERSAAISSFFEGTVPVLIEPLVKLILPVIKFVDPTVNFMTRFYLLLCLLWSLAVWAFFGGVITRIAAVQLTGKDRVTLKEAVRFVSSRYVSYLLSPVVPLGIIAVIVFCMAAYGLVGLIPILGDFVLYGLLMPLVLLGGLVMAILLVGLLGYPLMYTTISTEGSDTFDALSRSYNYVFQSPWYYVWYSAIAIIYGAVVTLFVVFLGSMTVYLGKWAVSQAPWSETTNRQPDYLFVYAPESFGWRQLFLKGSPIEEAENPNPGERRVTRYIYVKPDAKEYLEKYRWFEKAGAGMVTFWLVLAFMLMLGFSYSYFWSAATMIYLLMRKRVDETELDEIYIEEDLPEVPIPAPPVSPPPTNPGVASLPMVSPPPVVVPPPATLPFSPPPVVPPPAEPPPPTTPTI